MTSYVCKDCGAPISRAAASRNKRCRACATRLVSERARERWEERDRTNPLFCAWCGKQIKWNLSRMHQHVKTCSQSCASFLMQQKRKETKEHLEERLVDYIKKQGRYVPLSELRKVFRLSDKLVYSRGLSCPQLNLKAGVIDHLTTCDKTKEELQAEYAALVKANKGISKVEAAKRLCVSLNYMEKLGVSAKQVKKEAGVKSSRSKSAEEVESLVVSWLRTQPVYRNAQDICHALHIDFKCSIQNNGLDVVVLNAKAGHNKPSKSYYEDRAVYEFTQAGIKVEREHTFSECRDKTALRFDLWLPDYNALVEVNGQQHYEKKAWNQQYIEKHDKIKQAFAKEKGLILFVIDASPAKTYEDRLQGLIAKVKGLPKVTCGSADSIELQENLKTEVPLVQDNPQPSQEQPRQLTLF